MLVLQENFKKKTCKVFENSKKRKLEKAKAAEKQKKK